MNIVSVFVTLITIQSSKTEFKLHQIIFPYSTAVTSLQPLAANPL